jgi:hypothetical protein
MTLLDELRDKKRLTRMRLGQDAPEIVPLKTVPEVRVALVPLTEAQYHNALQSAASLDVAENAYGLEERDRILQVMTLLYAVRDPSDPSKQLFQTSEELTNEFEAVEVNWLMDHYARMVDDSSPASEGFSDEELGELKKALEKIEWSVLSGKPWWHLKSFLLTLSPEQLKVNYFGSTLTKKLTGTNENPESTPGASEN